jgi:16S rRNA (uracil1498-N3)-methyltransferase
VVERRDLDSALATFFVDGPLAEAQVVRLGGTTAHHARVRRLGTGQRVRLANGTGARATAQLTAVHHSEVEARVLGVDDVPRPKAIHLFAPIADRDRMLWLAEKATELGIASWQPVRFRRSASVSPRGEGAAFEAKLRARMIGALEQSGGAWLPEIMPVVDASEASIPGAAVGLVLDVGGAPVSTHLAATSSAVAIVLGPEGGMEPGELELLTARGWRSVRLAETTLRFETAALAAVAIARATTLTEDA